MLSQAPILQVAVYVVVALGVAVMLTPVAPVLHVIVPPTHPAAVNVTGVPLHIVLDGDTEIDSGVVLFPTLTVTLPGALSHLPGAFLI